MSNTTTDTALLRCLFDDLSADEFAALNDTLRDDPAARAAAVRLTRIAAALHTHRATLTQPPEAVVPSGTTDSPTPAPGTPGTPLSPAGAPIYRKGHEPKSAISNFPFPIFNFQFQLLAAALLIASGLGVYIFVTSLPQSELPDPTSTAPLANLIENSSEGTLTTPGGFISEGRDYPRGEYALDKGTAEFMLTNAVNVKLRGETRMHMRNDMNVALARGSAEFVVPNDATGFTVHLPDQTKVVDLGTRFRVRTHHDGYASVEVTDGVVELFPPHADAVKLVAGESAIVIDGYVWRSEPRTVRMIVADASPQTDEADIAQLVGGRVVNDETSAIWFDKPRQGQTFTTGSDAPGYLLKAITLRHAFDGRTWDETGPWELRFSIPHDDGGLTLYGVWQVKGMGLNHRPRAWVTFTFSRPIRLLPNTTYAFDLFSEGFGVVLESAPVEGREFPRGAAFRVDRATDPTPTTTMDMDRVFHLDITAEKPVRALPGNDEHKTLTQQADPPNVTAGSPSSPPPSLGDPK